MSHETPIVHLVDASPYVFRAYFALPDSIRDAEGNPANGLYGFASFLMKMVEDASVSHLALAFDESLVSSFRNQIYAGYKEARELPPADLERQFRRCRELASALGIATFTSDVYEAEDLLATLVAPLRAEGARLVVVSSDKDLAQLVADDVELWDLARDRRFDASAVLEKFGVEPEQIPDYLGLAGDSVDSIPGVPGVGAKTAAALLGAFPTLEAALDDLDRVETLPIRGAKSLRKKLETHAEQARLSKRLAQLADDTGIVASLADLALHAPDPERLEPVLEQLGSERLAKRLRAFPSAPEMA